MTMTIEQTVSLLLEDLEEFPEDDLSLDYVNSTESDDEIYHKGLLGKKLTDHDINILSMTAEGAYSYAVFILKAPFPKGEPAIAKSAEWSYLYARWVLEGPFPLGEPAIAKDSDNAYNYAVDVLKAPFPLGEPAIAEDATHWKDYCDRFGLK